MPRKKDQILQTKKVNRGILTNLNRKRVVDLRSIQDIALQLLKDEERVASELLKPVSEHCSHGMFKFIEEYEVIKALINKGYFLKTIDIYSTAGFRTGRQIQTEFRNLFFFWSNVVNIKIENTERNTYEIEMRVIS